MPVSIVCCAIHALIFSICRSQKVCVQKEDNMGVVNELSRSWKNI